MLSPEAVASLIAGLTEYAGGDRAALPAPEFQVISQFAPANGPKSLDFNLIHESVWRGWDLDRQVSGLMGVAEFTDLITSTANQWLRQQCKPMFTIVGFTLLYDDPTDTTAGPGGVATRVAAAADMDGRIYFVSTIAGRSGTVQVAEPGTPPTFDATDQLPPGNLPVALSALTRLVAIAADDLWHDAVDQPSDNDGGPLVAGEIVTVHGDRWDDDARAKLWVVIDDFADYTIAVLGGDGYQWPRVPRGELTPVSPDRIRKVRRDDTYAYARDDSTAPTPVNGTSTVHGAENGEAPDRRRR